MTSGIISGDQAAVKRIFSLISRPLNDFKDLYYPSFAEWVSCKVHKSTVSNMFFSLFTLMGQIGFLLLLFFIFWQKVA